jgi:hypothetical protein
MGVVPYKVMYTPGAKESQEVFEATGRNRWGSGQKLERDALKRAPTTGRL